MLRNKDGGNRRKGRHKTVGGRKRETVHFVHGLPDPWLFDSI